MEIKGTIEAIFETKEFKSGFKKREFVINTGGDYPQSVKNNAKRGIDLNKKVCQNEILQNV